MRASLPARVLLVLAGCLAACRRPAASPPPGLSYDLARLARVADAEGPLEVVLFGTPAAAPHEAEGFVLPADPPADEAFAWGRREVSVRLAWATVLPRRAVVDVAPYPGLRGQVARVFLNGHAIGQLDLGAARRRYRLSLPPALQASENVFRFVFKLRSPPIEPYGRHLSAAFHSLTIGPDGDARLEDLASEGAPPPLAVTATDGPPSLVQGAPAALRFALRVPARAELRFTPSLHPASAGSAVLRVTLDGAGGPERELWRGRVAPRPGSEVALPLDVAPGTLVRLGLHVDAGPEGRMAWGVWKGPRLLGDGPAGALAFPAPEDGRASRADGLRRPVGGVNVVLVVLDAAGAGHLGCYGYARRTTPEIDRIAAEGVVFEQAYSPAVYTLAAMSSVWTSQYPDQHQNLDVRTASLDRARLTLAELLSAGGIHTAGFVANGMAGPVFSFDRGFAEFQEVYSAQGSRAEGFRPVLPAWLRANARRPFFVYLHYREPHAPYDPPPPFDTLFGPDGPLPREIRSETHKLMARDRRSPLTPAELDQVLRLYDANLAYVDREVGFLRRTLEEQGLWERTALIVTADHGEALHEHGWIGHGTQLYEESVRIPLVVRFPAGQGPAGLRVRGLADSTDLAPTIADIFGVRGRGGSDREFRGRSLLPMLAGGRGKPVVFLRTSGERPKYAARDERFKLIFDSGTGRTELYDLEGDAAEAHDLAPAEPMTVAYYRQGLLGWLSGLKRATPASAPLKLSPRQIENLKALGYIQ